MVSVGGGLVEGTKAVHAFRAAQWPVVHGTILSSEIRPETLMTDVGSRGAVHRTIAKRFYVTYAYAVAGEPYTGSRFDALTSGGANFPHSAQAKYPRGAAADIHVDPSDPTRAVLEAPWPIGTVLIAIGELVLGGLVLRWAYKEAGRRRRSDGEIST